MTRYIGICGTAILAREFRPMLMDRYPQWLVDEAASFDDGIDELEKHDGNVLKALSPDIISYVASYSEFGVFEALFQLSKELKCGLDINIRDIPVKQETVEVCETVGANPYILYSGASMVIACNDSARVRADLERSDIPATVVGYTTSTNDKIVINEDERGFLPHVRKDDLKRILGRKVYYERTNIIRD